MHINIKVNGERVKFVNVFNFMERISIFIIWTINVIIDKSANNNENISGRIILRFLILFKYISKFSIDFVDINLESINLDSWDLILSISVKNKSFLSRKRNTIFCNLHSCQCLLNLTSYLLMNIFSCCHFLS